MSSVAWVTLTTRLSNDFRTHAGASASGLRLLSKRPPEPERATCRICIFVSFRSLLYLWSRMAHKDDAIC